MQTVIKKKKKLTNKNNGNSPIQIYSKLIKFVRVCNIRSHQFSYILMLFIVYIVTLQLMCKKAASY